MHRHRGMGGSFQRGRIWWIRFYHRGRQYRESTNSESQAEANKLLKRRLGEVGTGRFVPDEEKVDFEDLASGLITDYKLNARKSLNTAALNNIAHLRGYFGFDRAVDMGDRIKSYQVLRREQEASVATVNREVGTLRRMFSLAMESGKLSRKPVFKMLKGEKVRQGFVEHCDFLKLLDYLPEYLKPFVEFLYYSGWRKGAAKNLEWAQVDLEGRTARLKMEDSKNAEPWVLPLEGCLWEIVEERLRQRRLDIKLVFHHKGRGIGDIRKAWATACKQAGLLGLIIHDLRRCAARNLSRAGVPEVVAMKITGHKTNSMYRRYRIVDESELREAQERMQSHLKSQANRSKVAAIGGKK
ncbi:MAG: site-specific integrase [Deltaproteobacteria bacterium]|nr:site-specific integrase [Deltaproteobacteria bacterium]